MNVRNPDLFQIVFGIAVGMLSIWVIVRAVRYQSKLFRSRNWPTVPGTVQKGEILRSGATKILYVPVRSLLGYAYHVNGQPYCGLFALIAEDRETAEKLQVQADGRPVTVRYNPRSPEVSLLEDREFLGRRVIQDPMYLDHS
jgi:hypothetical protein